MLTTPIKFSPVLSRGSGYILKYGEPQPILQAIEEVMQEGAAINPSYCELLRTTFRTRWCTQSFIRIS